MAGDSTGVCDVEWQAIPAANRRSWSQDSQDMENLPDFGDHVDDQIFSQILEMDEDQSDRDFSAPLVFGFFEQAHETFEKMQDAL
jgi:osomolarity two-component system phosphorelay intermediate protein YPD1